MQPDPAQTMQRRQPDAGNRFKKPLWRVDFSLALYNRSGKYQIGKEIIDRQSPLIDSVWYWRKRSSTIPQGLYARFLGKAEKLERTLAVKLNLFVPVTRSGNYRWLHLDPLTACYRRPEECDVVLLHDLGPITNPELFPQGISTAYEFAFRVLLESGAKLVCVSEVTRQNFIERYGSPLRSEVIYPPIAARLAKGELARPIGIGDNFILTVGALGAR